jgi:nucleotide-binding universal stress UspA family protein
MTKKIAVGFDGSDGSWKALHKAIQLAAMDKSELHIVSVEELPSCPATMGEIIEEEEARNSKFHELHNQALEAGRTAGISEIKTLIRIGHPAMSLVDYADGKNFDLLVIGHSEHSGIWGTFLGTTADKITRHAKCSVLIVR